MVVNVTTEEKRKFLSPDGPLCQNSFGLLRVWTESSSYLFHVSRGEGDTEDFTNDTLRSDYKVSSLINDNTNKNARINLCIFVN